MFATFQGDSHEPHRPQGRTAHPGHPAEPARARPRERPQDAARSAGRRRAQGLDRRHRPAGEPGRPPGRTRRGWRRALRRGRRRAPPQSHAGAGRGQGARCRPSGALPGQVRPRRARRALACRERRPNRHAPRRPGGRFLRARPGRPVGFRHRGAFRRVRAHRRATSASRQRRVGAAGCLPGRRDRPGGAEGLRRHCPTASARWRSGSRSRRRATARPPGR